MCTHFSNSQHIVFIIFISDRIIWLVNLQFQIIVASFHYNKSIPIILKIHRITSHHIECNRMSLNNIPWCHITSLRTTSHRVEFNDISLNYITPSLITSHPIIPNLVTFIQIRLHRISSYNLISHLHTIHFIKSHHVT